MSYKPKELQVVWIKSHGNDPIYLQPFIEEFSHRIAPAINKELFGATSTPVTTLAGLSENTYTLRIVLAAHDGDSATLNFSKSQEIKKLVNPDIDKIGTSSSVKFYVKTLSGGAINAQIIGCQETIDIAAGFIFVAGQMYPKIIKLTMTFVQDSARLQREDQDPGAAGKTTGWFGSAGSPFGGWVSPPGKKDTPSKTPGTGASIAEEKVTADTSGVLQGTPKPVMPASKPNVKKTYGSGTGKTPAVK